MPLVRRTLATLRKAELGFLGVTVNTFRHMPRLKGEEKYLGLFLSTLNPKAKAGDLVFFLVLVLLFFNS